MSTAELKAASKEQIVKLRELQKTDSAIEILKHKRETLPERAHLTETLDLLGKVQKIEDQTTAQHDSVARDLKRKEDEVAVVEAKITREEGRLYGGTVRNPKELSALEDEIRHLKHRKGNLEGELLEIMEQAEVIDAKVAQVAEKKEILLGRRAKSEEKISSAESEIDSEIDTLAVDRQSLAGDLPDSILAGYDKMREQRQGVAIVVLGDGGICSGCHRELPSTEYDHFIHQKVFYPCPHCHRLIVPRA